MKEIIRKAWNDCPGCFLLAVFVIALVDALAYYLIFRGCDLDIKPPEITVTLTPTEVLGIHPAKTVIIHTHLRIPVGCFGCSPGVPHPHVGRVS